MFFVSTKSARALFGGIALYGIMLGVTSTSAQAQSCAEAFDDCVSACMAACQGEACRENCENGPACLAIGAACAAEKYGAAAVAEEATAAAEAPAAAPRARSLALDPLAADLTPLSARIFFLTRGATEPDALFYGYLIVGAQVSDARKAAVAKGLACRLDVVDAESAASIEKLGTVAIPASKTVSDSTVSPADLLSAYDFPRAERWLRAASFALNEDFDIDEAVLFVGSRQPRGAQLDAVALPTIGRENDPVIADASALSARYLERWTFDIVAGVRHGQIKSRQDLQGLMAAHSWLEAIGDPVAAILRIAPAQAAEPPPAACF